MIDGPPLVFTIKTFCQAHHLSEARFHELRNEGIGPRLMRVGRRVFITAEAAAEWRAEREAATAKREAATPSNTEEPSTCKSSIPNRASRTPRPRSN